MSFPAPIALLAEYAEKRSGQFTRVEFLMWASHHGLSRHTPREAVDRAFEISIQAGNLVLTPDTIQPLYRKAP